MSKPVYEARNHEIVRVGGVTLMWCDVYGHDKFPDGDRIRTSVIQEMSSDKVETLNSVYILREDESIR